MPHHDEDDEAVAENVNERELPDESDMDDGDEPELVPCPHCRQMVSEEAEVCPECGNYVSREDAPSPRQSTLWAVIIVLLIASLAGALWWFR